LAVKVTVPVAVVGATFAVNSAGCPTLALVGRVSVSFDPDADTLSAAPLLVDEAARPSPAYSAMMVHVVALDGVVIESLAVPSAASFAVPSDVPVLRRNATVPVET